MSDKIKNYLSNPANKNKLIEKLNDYRRYHPDEAKDGPGNDFLLTMLMHGWIDEDAPTLARSIDSVLSNKPTPEPQEEEQEIVLEEYKKPYEVWTWVPERDDPDLNGKNKKGV